MRPEGAGTGRGGVPRVTSVGSGAVLLDAAAGPFDEAVQRRVWAVGRAAGALEAVREIVPGMNNLLVAFDALSVTPSRMADRLLQLWHDTPATEIAGSLFEVPVHYGGPHGADLTAWAAHCGLPLEEAVRRHAAPTYSVAAIGAMPGFPYLSGLDPALACPRRATPRHRVPEGAVIVGGSQAGIMPQTAPSGWHMLGRCDLKLFNPAAERPVLLRPGDAVRFRVAGLAP